MTLHQETSVFIGIDGGQSSMTAAIVDATGHVLGTGIGGPIAHPGNSRTASASNTASLRAAVEHAWQMVGIGDYPPAVEAAHIATTAAAGELRTATRSLLGIEQVSSVPDIDVVLAAGARETGIALAAGTGVVARAVGPTRAQTIGGWGWLLGDEGSAYWLGVEGVRAAARAFDGRGPATALSEVVLNTLGVANLHELFDHVHTNRVTRPAIATLAAAVAEHAGTDEVAAEIIDRAAGELAHLAMAARHAVPDAPPVLVTAGGVLTPGPVLAALITHLAAVEPELEVRPAIVPAAVAAALVAAGRVTALTVETARASLATLTSEGRNER